MKIRTLVLSWTLVAAFCLPSSLAQAQGNWQAGDFGSVRVRLGIFEPDGGSAYWREKEIDWTGSAEDLEDLSLGLDWLWSTSRQTGILFGLGFYEGSTHQAYREWVDDDGHDIWHRTSLDTFELTAAWMRRFRTPVAGLSPYLGVGVGLLAWNLEEYGDFIDFGDPEELEIVRVAYRSSGTTYQGFAFLGLEAALGDSVSVFAEGRWKKADDELDEDFAGFGTIDLSGVEYSVGISWSF